MLEAFYDDLVCICKSYIFVTESFLIAFGNVKLAQLAVPTFNLTTSPEIVRLSSDM